MKYLLAIPIALANVSFLVGTALLAVLLFTWPLWLIAWIIWRFHF